MKPQLKVCDLCGFSWIEKQQTLAGGWIAVWHEDQTLPEIKQIEIYSTTK